MPMFLMRLAVVALLAIVLHAIEAAAWAAASVRLGALPGQRIATLYSFGAMTSHGHANDILPRDWQLKGALRAIAFRKDPRSSGELTFTRI